MSQKKEGGGAGVAGLEDIVDVLVECASELRRKRDVDLSMFPKERVPEIYFKAAEAALEKGEFESVGFFLERGGHWDKLLVLGEQYFNSEGQKDVGKDFLWCLAVNDRLSGSLCVELADYLIESRASFHLHNARWLLEKAGAKSRARELGYLLLGEGNFEEGTRFLEVGGVKEFSKDEAKKYARVALEKGEFRDAFVFFEYASLPMSRGTAKALADVGDSWLFGRVLKYMEGMDDSFTLEDFAGFGDALFELGRYDGALEFYKRAGRVVPREKFKRLGEQILGVCPSSWGSGDPCPNVRRAFAYLSEYDPKEAREEVFKFADELLLGKPRREVHGRLVYLFRDVYKLLGEEMPVDKALAAAGVAEGEECFMLAAEYYVAAKRPWEARRMGWLALESREERGSGGRSRRDFWLAKECFGIAGDAGDEEGSAVSEFIARNFRDDYH